MVYHSNRLLLATVAVVAGSRAACDDNTVCRLEPQRETALLQKQSRIECNHPKVVLGSETFNVTVFLPPASNGRGYYKSTRFDWSSMIGDVHFAGHRFFPSDFWRQPHDPSWTESGVGMASEFGCGDDGDRCRSGWSRDREAPTNGVLGYKEAEMGAPFLKIGVGKLVKGSCKVGTQRCRENERDYKFNSPYQLVELPTWRVSYPTPDSVTMEQEMKLNSRWGYRLTKHIEVVGQDLRIWTELKNTGSEGFTTPHYSHNFLSADRKPIGAEWSLAMDVNLRDYRDSSWATPLRKFLSRDDQDERLYVQRDVDEGVIMKANYGAAGGQRSEGRFEAFYSGVQITHSIENPPPLYAYNLFIERTTLSPEPLLLLHADAGEAISWTHSYKFSNA